MALTDQFELNTYAWEDDIEDLPITYIFAYVSGSANESDTSEEVVLRVGSESSEASDVYLPQVGDSGTGGLPLYSVAYVVMCFSGEFYNMMASRPVL